MAATFVTVSRPRDVPIRSGAGCGFAEAQGLVDISHDPGGPAPARRRNERSDFLKQRQRSKFPA